MVTLLNNARNTFTEIRHHKFMVILLIIIQTLFIVAFAFTFLSFQLRILESAQGIIQPLQEANFDADSIDEGQPFLDDPLAVYNSYQAMIRNVYHLVGWLVGLFLLFNGLLWVTSQQMLNHQKFSLKKFGKKWLKFAALFLAVIIPFLALCYYLIKNAVLSTEPNQLFASNLKILGIVLVVLYYLALVSFTNLNLSWKSLLKETWKKSKKLSKTIPVLVINVILIALGIYAIYQTLISQQLTTYLVPATFLLIIILVITRLYWLICLDEKNIP